MFSHSTEHRGFRQFAAVGIPLLHGALGNDHQHGIVHHFSFGIGPNGHPDGYRAKWAHRHQAR